MRLKEFYVAIAEVYQQVAQAVPSYPGNPCGDCRSCCTSILARHKVSELEFATMAFHLGEKAVEPFRRYLQRERNQQGDLVYTQCPNLGPQGCEIHEFRPMACRLYGHFRSESSELFEHCAFRGLETVLPDDQEHLLTPGQQRLTELNIEYLSYFPSYTATATTQALKAPQTELERASLLQLNGEYAAAVELLLRLRLDNHAPRVLLMLAECYESLSDYAAALTVLDEAITRSPQNPELYTKKGGNCLWLGKLAEGREALARSLELAPDRRNALGLLGYIHLLEGDFENAADRLGRAVELEDEPGPYRLPLAQAFAALERKEECHTMLLKAREFPPTAEQAQRMLGSGP